MRTIPGKIGERIQKICSAKRIAVLSILLYLVSLIPLFLLSRYNYPSADDYTNGVMCRQAWDASHSLIRVLAAAFERMTIEWHTWRGCYTSAFLSALSPQIFGERFYGITTWIVLIMVTLALFSLFHTVLVKMLGADCWTSAGIAALTAFLTVQCTPGGNELFYWYSGAINYTFLFGLSLLFYRAMLNLLKMRKKPHAASVIGASVLGFLVGGANQMTSLNAAILLMALCLLLICRKNRSEYRRLAIPAIVFFIGFVLSIIAPGNFVRAAGANGMNPIKAILVSFFYCLDPVISKWLTWPVIVVLIAMVPMFWRASAKSSFRFSYPLVVVLFGYCLVSAMMTPALFAVGNIDSGRAQGTVFSMFILVLVLCVGYVTGWVEKKFEQSAAAHGADLSPADAQHYDLNAGICLTGCMLFLIFGILLTLVPSPRSFTFGSAAVDCLNGSAAAYAETMQSRADLYQEGKGQFVEVEPLKEKPELLFFSDITPDANDWTNNGVARFYWLEGVAVRKAADVG